VCCVDVTAGREYVAADTRWGTADPTVVSLELLTVFGAGPLAALIVYQIVKRDPARHYWIVVLSTAELYGGYVWGGGLFSFLRPFPLFSCGPWNGQNCWPADRDAAVAAAVADEKGGRALIFVYCARVGAFL